MCGGRFMGKCFKEVKTTSDRIYHTHFPPDFSVRINHQSDSLLTRALFATFSDLHIRKLAMFANLHTLYTRLLFIRIAQ